MGSFKDEDVNCEYLKEIHLEKTLPKLIKKLKGKRIALYGPGSFFQCVNKYYDLSELNIVAVADRMRFVYGSNNTDLLIKKYYETAGISIYGITDKTDETETDSAETESIKIEDLDNLKNHNIDCIVIAIKQYVPVVETLYEKFKNTNIKIRPLAQKSLWLLLKELD